MELKVLCNNQEEWNEISGYELTYMQVKYLMEMERNYKNENKDRLSEEELRRIGFNQLIVDKTELMKYKTLSEERERIISNQEELIEEIKEKNKVIEKKYGAGSLKDKYEIDSVMNRGKNGELSIRELLDSLYKNIETKFTGNNADKSDIHVKLLKYEMQMIVEVKNKKHITKDEIDRFRRNVVEGKKKGLCDFGIMAIMESISIPIKTTNIDINMKEYIGFEKIGDVYIGYVNNLSNNKEHLKIMTELLVQMTSEKNLLNNNLEEDVNQFINERLSKINGMKGLIGKQTKNIEMQKRLIMENEKMQQEISNSIMSEHKELMEYFNRRDINLGGLIEKEGLNDEELLEKFKEECQGNNKITKKKFMEKYNIKDSRMNKLGKYSELKEKVLNEGIIDEIKEVKDNLYKYIEERGIDEYLDNNKLITMYEYIKNNNEGEIFKTKLKGKYNKILIEVIREKHGDDKAEQYEELINKVKNNTLIVNDKVIVSDKVIEKKKIKIKKVNKE